jgi:prevent-host-death family protein
LEEVRTVERAAEGRILSTGLLPFIGTWRMRRMLR